MVLEYEYVMVVCWYRWELLDELTVLLLIVFGFITPVIGLRSLWLGWLPLWLDSGPCDWAFAPVIGFITPVIGLRSLWLDYGPCDWVFTPAYRFSGFDSWFVTMRWVWFGGWFWRLELGFFLGWFVSPLCHSVVTLLFSLSLVGSFGWLFSWYLGYWFVLVLCFHGWILALFDWVLVIDSFSLLLLSIDFELLNSLLVFIFYTGV